MSSELTFEQAAERAKQLPDQSNQNLLALYKFYKQATVGDAGGSRPGMFDIRGRAKYDAWATAKGMSTEEARQAYIDLVERLANG
jgi:acyl-CoA-binding protein